jgi:hypothetical protein
MNISLVLLSVFEYPACTDLLVFFRAGNDTPLMLPAGKKAQVMPTTIAAYVRRPIGPS